MPEIEIRPTVLADLPTLNSLEHYFQTNYVWQMERVLEAGQVNISFREVHLPRAIRVDYPKTEEIFTDGKRLYQAMFSAIMQNVPVGYICLTEQFSPGSSWVMHLVVGDSLRRQGIGTGLMHAAEEWAQRKHFRRIILEMQSKNHPAIQMAQKLGYDFCGYNDQYYPNHDIALLFGRYLR